MGALRFVLLLRLCLRAQPARRQPSPCTPPPRQWQRDTHGTQRRRQPIFHRLGTTCGELPNPGSRVGESPLSNGAAHRWKAPRVQQNASLFAERRGKRPWRRWGSRKRSPSQAGSRARRGSQRRVVISLDRRDAREIGRLAQPRASRPARWARQGSTRERVAPGGVGLSSRHRGELYDSRCPSRSGRGEASVARNRDGRRREERKPPGP
jgi:hypothetical protein